MSYILSSATKTVLVLFSVVLCLSLLIIVGFNPKDHDLLVGLLALFSSAVTLIIGFYFGQKAIPGSEGQNTSTTTNTVSTPKE